MSHLRRWRAYDWYGRYLDRLQSVRAAQASWDSPWALLALVPPLLVVGVLQAFLQGGVLTLLGLLFSILVLVFAMGPRDIWEQVHTLIAARKAGDKAKAEALTTELTETDAAASRGELIEAVVLAGHERVLAVLLWFIVLGPLGAAGYRLVAASPAQFERVGAGRGAREAALRLHALVAWAPQRLALLLYGLAGSGDGALAGARAVRGGHSSDWAAYGWLLLRTAGVGAVGLDYSENTGEDSGEAQAQPDEALRQALGLVTRSVVVLLGVLAAFTIGGWLA